jgi:dihydroneopterin aldolase/2-amino-4-hydroxy-6-hydroxymethyldihydropteridine diphosphokinase
MTNRIFVSNLCLFGHHGVLKEEAALGQRFFFDIDCTVDMDEALRGDDYRKTVGYEQLCDIASRISGATRFDLIETLADRIAATILDTYPAVSEVSVTIRKPSAPVAAVLDHVGVEATRHRKTEFAMSLGSNVGNKVANIRAAIARLDAEDGIEVKAVSHLYKTAPWGKTDQDWFVNACLRGTTRLSPEALLKRTQAIEIQVGRLPGVRWGPRIIDIDILYAGDAELQSAGLTLPHPEMLNRVFVLLPLAEIAPDKIIGGTSVAEAATVLPRRDGDVTRIDDPYL